jgi:hypothetical protein
MRKLRRDMNRRMLWLVVFVLVVVGGALIAAVYGAGAAAVGLACLLAGAGLIGLLWLVFSLIGRWTGDE